MIRMTNGEMIQKVFDCEVCEPLPEDDIIHVIFPDKNDSAIGFDWSWWNMEYKDPTTKNNLGVDAISREQAIEEADKLCLETGYDNEKVIEMLNDLPTVTPQPRKGHWKEHPHEAGPNWKYSMYECSECHGWLEDDSDYCPDCGAKMVESQESEVENGNDD